MLILEYINETFEGLSILPKDPYDRALARFWAKFLDDKVAAVVNTFLRKGEEQEKGKEEVCEMLKVLDNELKDKKFFVGDKFGFADMAANLMGLWLGVFEEGSEIVLVTSEKFLNFCAWTMSILIVAKSRNIYLQEMSCLHFFKLELVL